MQLFQFAGEGVGVGGRESPSPIGWERVADRPGEGQPSSNVQHVQPRKLSGFHFQPRCVTEMSFNGLTRLNRSRTSFTGSTWLSVTTAIRASTGNTVQGDVAADPPCPARRWW